MKPKIGDYVLIAFADHAEDSSSCIDFHVIGKLAKKTRKEYVVDSWYYADPKTPYDDNVKRFVIGRGLIQKLVILTEQNSTYKGGIH
jgi:hypothetical protein